MKLLKTFALVIGVVIVTAVQAQFSNVQIKSTPEGALDCNVKGMEATEGALSNLKAVQVFVNKGNAAASYLAHVQKNVREDTVAFCKQSNGTQIDKVIAYANQYASDYADDKVGTMDMLVNPNLASNNKTNYYVIGYRKGLTKIVESNGQVLEGNTGS